MHKIQSGNSTEGQKDTEKMSRKSKASCKSIKAKLNTIEKEMQHLKEENRKLLDKHWEFKNSKIEIAKLTKEKQEAHGPHRSPEKTVQINKHIWLYHNVD